MKKLLLQQLLLLSFAAFGAPLFAGEDDTIHSEVTSTPAPAAEAKEDAVTPKVEEDTVASEDAEEKDTEKDNDVELEEKPADLKTPASADILSEEASPKPEDTEKDKAGDKDDVELEEKSANLEAPASADISSEEASPKPEDIKEKVASKPEEKLEGKEKVQENKDLLKDDKELLNDDKDKEWNKLEIAGGATLVTLVVGAVGLGIKKHYNKKRAQLIKDGEDTSSMSFFAIIAA